MRSSVLAPLLLLTACTVQSAFPGLSTTPTPRPGTAPEATGATPDPGLGPTDQPASAPVAAESAGDDREAHRDHWGEVVAPGGRITTIERTCDAAADHCLRPNAWFVSVDWDGATTAAASVAFRFEDKLWTYRREEEYPGKGHRTEPASPANARVGAGVVVHGDWMRHGGSPRHEDAALTGSWLIGTIGDVDAAAGTFHFAGKEDGKAVALGDARVIVETR